jgi:N-acetylglutamate synthase-like GNAT family acetyltransferase
MNIRQADMADADALEALINKAYEVENFFVTGNRIHSHEISAYLVKGYFFVALIEQLIVGCIYLELKNKRAYFGLLSVHPSYQGKGIGKELIFLAENFGRRHHCSHMDMNVVNLREELPPFYRKLGYEVTGEQLPFAPRTLVTDKPVFFILMSKTLLPE